APGRGQSGESLARGEGSPDPLLYQGVLRPTLLAQRTAIPATVRGPRRGRAATARATKLSGVRPSPRRPDRAPPSAGRRRLDRRARSRLADRVTPGRPPRAAMRAVQPALPRARSRTGPRRPAAPD